ncbi:MAG: polysaccharide deacetylase family protein [Egibacteraceae bacterium]
MRSGVLVVGLNRLATVLLSSDRVWRALIRGRSRPSRAAQGVSLLAFHHIEGATEGEFARQISLLRDHDVVSLDAALDGLARGDRTHRVVLTFDGGSTGVYRHAWPLLEARRLPFTVYLVTAQANGQPHLGGSAAPALGPLLTWDQAKELSDSGLCTIGNSAGSHGHPERFTPDQLDLGAEEIERHVGVAPAHFAYPWSVPARGIEAALRMRFRSAATGRVGRNLPGDDPIQLKRIPVRETDPLDAVAAKLAGHLFAERAYASILNATTRVGVPA